MKLFMLMLGCKPPGRHTEQHDIFFGIGETVKDLIPQLKAFWPEAKDKLHVDAWREVTHVNGYHIQVVNRDGSALPKPELKLFFINLGGYREGLFDEPHFKVLTVQASRSKAFAYAKSTSFFHKFHFPGAESHIDDKYGLDVDDLYEINEILPQAQKTQYRLQITPAANQPLDDKIHLGYFKLNTLP